MSLVLVAVEPGLVTVATDSVSYATNTGEITWSSKVHTLPHLRAVLASNGNAAAPEMLYAFLHGLNSRVRGIDDLVDDLPTVLQHMWTRPDPAGPLVDQPGAFSNIYIAGWSIERDAHVVQRYSSALDFEPTFRVDGLSIYPDPIDGTGLAYPQTVEDWITLAERIRQEQIDQEGGRVLIGGRLILTQLARDGLSQHAIHCFDDSAETWAHYLRGLKAENGDPFQPPEPMSG